MSDADPGDEADLRIVVDDVTVWRYQRFHELGFNDLQTLVLAGKRRDWHKARDMVEHGCAPDVAFEILA